MPSATKGTLAWIAERPVTARTWIAAGVLVIFAALNAVLLSGTALRSARTRDYRAWTAALEAGAIAPLPDGTRVLLNSIPDPYPALLGHRDRLRLRHVPPRDSVPNGAVLDADVVILEPTQLDPALATLVHGEPDVWRVHAVAAGGYTGRVAVRRPLALPECAPPPSQGRGEPPGSP